MGILSFVKRALGNEPDPVMTPAFIDTAKTLVIDPKSFKPTSSKPKGAQQPKAGDFGMQCHGSVSCRVKGQVSEGRVIMNFQKPQM